MELANRRKVRCWLKHQGKVKGTDKPSRIRSFSQILADFCRFSLFLGIAALRRSDFRRNLQETADFCRKPQETADFRRKPQETADFRRNPFVQFSLSLSFP